VISRALEEHAADAGDSCHRAHFSGADAETTHCHLLLAIFTHVSAHRSFASTAFPDPSESSAAKSSASRGASASASAAMLAFGH
jgi:hypothetical protein